MRARHCISIALLTTLSACGGLAPRVTPTRPTPTVLILGDHAHELGQELGRDGDMVLVARHGGPDVWVDASRVVPEAIETGTPVLVRWGQDARAWEASVRERWDSVVRVQFTQDQSTSLMALSDVLAVVPEGIPAPPLQGDPPPPDEPTPAETVDPERQVGTVVQDVWTVARAIRCSDGVVVMHADGSTEAVPTSRLSPRPVSVGDRVLARYQNGVLSYQAVVHAVDEDRVHVRYDDDNSEEWLPIGALRYVLRPAADVSTVAPASHPVCRQLRGVAAPQVLVRRGTALEASTLEECADGNAVIVSRGGERRQTPLAQLSRFSLQPGDVVQLPWSNTHFAATIVTVDGAQFTVRYEDGTEEPRSLGEVLLLLEASSERAPEPASCP